MLPAASAGPRGGLESACTDIPDEPRGWGCEGQVTREHAPGSRGTYVGRSQGRGIPATLSVQVKLTVLS